MSVTDLPPYHIFRQSRQREVFGTFVSFKKCMSVKTACGRVVEEAKREFEAWKLEQEKKKENEAMPK